METHFPEGWVGDSTTPRPSDPPTRDEVARVRQLYEQWLAEADQLTSYALVWQIPRLLARIEHLEALLAERVS